MCYAQENCQFDKIQSHAAAKIVKMLNLIGIFLKMAPALHQNRFKLVFVRINSNGLFKFPFKQQPKKSIEICWCCFCVWQIENTCSCRCHQISNRILMLVLFIIIINVQTVVVAVITLSIFILITIAHLFDIEHIMDKNINIKCRKLLHADFCACDNSCMEKNYHM